MNLDKLKTLIPMLENTDSKVFSMGYVQRCVAGVLYSNQYSDKCDIAFVGYHTIMDTLSEYVGLPRDKDFDHNLHLYLFGGQWAYHRELDTPQHAILRINNILNGYKPGPIYDEIDLALTLSKTK